MIIKIDERKMAEYLTWLYVRNDKEEATRFMQTYDILSNDIGHFLDKYFSDDARNFLCECIEEENKKNVLTL